MPALDARTARSHSRLLPRTTAALALATALAVVPATAAQAHHGFADFDTDRLYYMAGTVSDVRWGEPHSYFTVSLESGLPADTPDLALPEQLQSPEDSGPINVAPSYPGSRDALDVVIAPPSYTGRWGLDRPLVDGERVEAVGYVGRSHDDEFRPVVFWFEDGKPVNQVLGSELPARPLSVPYPQNGAQGADSEQGTAAAEDPGSTSRTVVWVALVAGFAALVAGGAGYLRARARRGA